MSNCNICGKEEERTGIDGFGEFTYRPHQHKDTSKRKYKHYHVLNGLPDCMPDSNFVVRTKKQAQRGIVQTVRMLNDEIDFYDDTTETLKGSAKSGWYQTKDGSYYAEISTCYESDCLESLDE